MSWWRFKLILWVILESFWVVVLYCLKVFMVFGVRDRCLVLSFLREWIVLFVMILVLCVCVMMFLVFFVKYCFSLFFLLFGGMICWIMVCMVVKVVVVDFRWFCMRSVFMWILLVKFFRLLEMCILFRCIMRVIVCWSLVEYCFFFKLLCFKLLI